MYMLCRRNPKRNSSSKRCHIEAIHIQILLIAEFQSFHEMLGFYLDPFRFEFHFVLLFRVGSWDGFLGVLLI